MSNTLDIQINDQENGEISVALMGKLDHSNFEKLEGVLNDFIQEKKIFTFNLDFEDLEYISSVGVGVLISAITQAQASNGKILMINVNSRIGEVFRLLGLPDEFYETI